MSDNDIKQVTVKVKGGQRGVKIPQDTYFVSLFSGTASDRNVLFEALITQLNALQNGGNVLVKPNRKWQYGGLNPKKSYEFPIGL